ncbi:MAG: glutamate--tRNA ligase family protein [Candidatus Eremiobacteraeota bacterium]|nr:glutamate--tRNA ligase family protein [Candidatus Eremiobacteraeota bacterium]
MSRATDTAAARIALVNFLFAKRTNGVFILRIDDKAEQSADHESAIMSDLRWLGLSWDEGPDVGGKYAPYRQSERAEIYARVASRLLEMKRAYRCYCTTQECSGECRGRNPAGSTGLEAQGGTCAVRFAVTPGETVVHDLIKGDISLPNDECGDFILVKPSGVAASSFASILDDALMDISIVMRGEEYLSKAPLELLILEALGLHAPRFAHLPMVWPDRSDYRERTIGLHQLRAQGIDPHALSNQMAFVGWANGDDREDLTKEELIAGFSLERIREAPSACTQTRLRASNQCALRKLSLGELRKVLAREMQRAGLLEMPVPAAAWRWIDTFLAAYREELRGLSDVIPIVRALRAEAVVVPALELERLRSREVVFYLDAVSQYVDAQAELRDLPLNQDLVEIAKEFGLQSSDAFATVRMALTGEKKGAPLTLLFPLLGHDRIMMRIGAVSSHLLHGRGLEPIKYGPDGQPFRPIHGTKPPGRETSAS